MGRLRRLNANYTVAPPATLPRSTSTGTRCISAVTSTSTSLDLSYLDDLVIAGVPLTAHAVDCLPKLKRARTGLHVAGLRDEHMAVVGKLRQLRILESTPRA